MPLHHHPLAVDHQPAPRPYVAFLLDKYKSLDGINEAYLEQNRETREIYAIRERPTYRTWLPGTSLKIRDWQEFKEKLSEDNLEFINIGDIDGEWGLFIQSKYPSEEAFNAAFGTEYSAFYRIPLSFTAPPEGTTDAEAKLRALWIEFAKNRVPLRFMRINDPDERYRAFLQARYSDIDSLNKLYDASYASFDDLSLPSEITYNSTQTSDIYDFILSDAVRPEDITITGVRWYWMQYLKGKYGTLDAANDALSISYASWDDVTLPRRLPLNQTLVQQLDWKEFVATTCPLPELLDNFDQRRLREFLQGEYGTVAKLNEAWGTSYKEFRNVTCPRGDRLTEKQAADLRRMLAIQAMPLFEIDIPDTVPATLYTDFLKKKYGTVEDYDRAVRLYPTWDDVKRPTDEIEFADFSSRRNQYKKEYLTGNYTAVVNYMALHGRAFFNTGVLCTAMVLAALTVNPLCAYALSRFQLSYANSILLFLLATMAFPVAVTQIPNFLMLKNLGMLNTYWALILPGLANGYSIFLLKGFFDSLPQELFEAGLIDGASEVQMFYRIALPLTTPILAVIALGAFTLAYGQFMWAFIVCQNPQYWTIMVWLYQFQQDYAVPLVMAGLVLASLPTLLVFIAAQKVILRGIVVPQMK